MIPLVPSQCALCSVGWGNDRGVGQVSHDVQREQRGRARHGRERAIERALRASSTTTKTPGRPEASRGSSRTEQTAAADDDDPPKRATSLDNYLRIGNPLTTAPVRVLAPA